MITQRQCTKSNRTYWEASGNGPIRPIVVEAFTRAAARSAFIQLYGQQVRERDNAPRN